jgi:addiction module RelE/StbE family toxin
LFGQHQPKHDLQQIFEYIADDNVNAASKLLNEIDERVTLLLDNPSLGRAGRVENTKELVLTGTNYILPYRVVKKQIQILAVFHTSREWPNNF